MPITDPPEILQFSKRRNLSDFTEDLLSGSAGVTAIEYVVIICFTAAMAIISWGYLGGNLQTLFTNIGCYVTGSSNCSTDDESDDAVAVAAAESDESDDDEDDSDNHGDDEDDSDEDDDGHGDDDEED